MSAEILAVVQGSALAAAIGAGDLAERLRRLIKLGILETTQVVPCAPWRLDPAVVDTEAIRKAAKEVEGRKLRSRSPVADSHTLVLPGI